MNPEKMMTATFMDRTRWGPGPWDGEPDRAIWTDEPTGLTCLVRRSPFSGAWCGYVAVPPGHPWHGSKYGGLASVDVHGGGVTYARACDGNRDRGICHHGEAPVWWVGFDCGHDGDRAPRLFGNPFVSLVGMLGGGFGEDGGIYRDLAYARAETARLAVQARAAAGDWKTRV